MVTGTAHHRKVISGLRPFNPARDLKQVIELLRLAFPDEMGRSETMWLQDLEILGALKPIIWLLNQLNLLLGSLFYGFVWVEEGRVVGNVTINRLSPQNWLISNVAVHPAYRRQGIARQLMLASLNWLRQRNARWATLEVRRDNQAAKQLYLNVGFVVIEGRTEMERSIAESVLRVPPPAGYQVRRARPQDSDAVLELAQHITSPKLQEITPLRRRDYEVSTLGGLWGTLRQIIGLPTRWMWVITTENDQIVGVLKLVLHGRRNRIELLIHPDHRGRVEETLITHALHMLQYHRGTLSITVNADDTALISLLETYGFRQIRTLDLMALELSTRRQIPIIVKS